MKIVLFASNYAPAVGGVEELTSRLAGHLQATGDDVEVWTHRHPPTLAASDVIERIRVRRFALPLPRLSVGPLVQFTAAGPLALLRLQRAARVVRPDVVHVQCFSTNGVYATALTALLNVPLVVTLQGETVMDDHDVYEHSLSLRVGLRAGLRRAQAVTACSQFVLDDARRRFGLPSRSGAVIPNGVAVTAPMPSALPHLPFSRFVFGVGRLVEKKGFDLLVRAFARIAVDHADVGLVVGGDGSARPGLIRLISELGLADRVVLPGVLSRGQVAWAMANASVFVMPSRVEPFGIVVLEALRGGRPTVVSNQGGASEIVRDGRDGLVVDPTDTAAMAGAIARLLTDGPLQRQLADTGPERAREFAWESIAERYRCIYRHVVGT